MHAQKEKSSDRPEEYGSAALQARQPGIVGEVWIGERRGGKAPLRVFWMGLSFGGQFSWEKFYSHPMFFSIHPIKNNYR